MVPAVPEPYFWVPVFFLYYQSKLPIDEVLLIESIYYGGVVVLEVPSGWFSDRIGRRVTLVISAVALTAGYALWKNNFLAAARQGLKAQFAWMKGEMRTAEELIRDHLIPLAREGLRASNVDEGDAEGYLDCSASSATARCCACSRAAARSLTRSNP